MPRTQPQLAVRDELYRVPRFSRDWALFLDVDGTLLDIAPQPGAVDATIDDPIEHGADPRPEAATDPQVIRGPRDPDERT